MNDYLKIAQQCGLIESSSNETIANLMVFATLIANHENDRCFRIVSKQIPEYDEDPHAHNLLSLIAYKVGTYE